LARIGRRSANARTGVSTGGLGDFDRFDHGLEQVVRLTVQEVAQRGQDLHVHPLRGLGDQAVDELTGQVDVSFGQHRDQVTGLEDAAGGHDLAQVPLHHDPSGHHWPSLLCGE